YSHTGAATSSPLSLRDALPTCRRPSTRAGALRIVEVADFDVSACGGTHVARTGEIGMVMALAWERVRAGTRLSFVCGGRALTARSEEHTSELQSRENLVCRLLL